MKGLIRYISLCLFVFSVLPDCNTVEANGTTIESANGFLVRDSFQYSFLVDSLSGIQYPDTLHHDRRDAFFAKIDSIVLCHHGKASILHIGGSHVQADMFSHRVRCRLDSVNGTFQPSRGVIFPYRIAKTNNPTNYSVSYKGVWTASKNVKRDRVATLGMMGMAVTSSDPLAEMTICMNPSDSIKRWQFNHLTLMGYTDSLNLCEPVIKLTDSTFLYATHDKVAETYRFEFPQLTDTFRLDFIQKDTLGKHPFTVCGFVVENDEQGVVYHSIGVNGASVPSYLSCENFQRDMQLIKPDMVIFAIGINDAVPENFSEQTFMANYDSLIAKIEAVSPGCFYVFITNNDSFRKVRKNRKTRYYVNKNGLKVQHAFRMLAEKYQGGYWDLFGWMGGLESMATWEKNGLAKKDKIHFTQKGYSLIGDAFYNALMKSYLEDYGE